ncbi:MAG: TonB-dependent receptor [Bryobacteraceae bacterium]|nr:TonB-dependent receptor [Bryobacteraceae bacterium]
MRVALLLTLSVCAAFGQDAQLSGFVRDPQDSVIMGAKVTVLNEDRQTKQTVTTNDSGLYTFEYLVPGRYRIEVVTAGFRTEERSDLRLEVAQKARLDFTLQIGAVSDTVTVVAAPVLLATETPSFSTQVDKRRMDTLPFQLTGALRNPISFIRLTPGASGSGFGNYINGSRQFGNEVLVDGVPVAYRAITNSPDSATPSYDTVEEFRVEGAVPPAEYGRTSTGLVLLSLRSGTNEYHGNVVGLFRNNVLDARRFNARIPDITRQGEFAGSLGGPVILPKVYDGRKRTFFFANYTGFRRHNEVQGVERTVATTRMRAGDFSEFTGVIYDPASARPDGSRLPFPNNLIPAQRFSSFSSRFQQLIPLPNRNTLASNFVGVQLSDNNADTVALKGDHYIGERTRLSLTFRKQTVKRDNNGPFLTGVDLNGDTLYTHNAAANLTSSLNSRMLNSLQLGFSRFYAPVFFASDPGLRVTNSFEPGFPIVSYTGQGLATVGANANRLVVANNYHIQDSVSLHSGRHDIKVGFRADEFHDNWSGFNNRNGTYTFAPFATADVQQGGGHAYASFLLGLADRATLTKAIPYGIRSHYFGVYGQDVFKLNSRLTLSYGLRWEFQTPWYEVHGRLSKMDPNLPNPGAAGRPGAMIFAGEGPGRIGGRRFQETYLKALAPRLGIAWQLTRDTVLRVGYGMMYSPIILSEPTNLGFTSDISIASQDGGLTPILRLDQGWPSGLVREPPSIDPTLANGQTAYTYEPGRDGSGRLSRTNQWQVNVQQRLGAFVAEVAYVATLATGINNDSLININQVDSRYLSLGALLTRPISDPAVAQAGFGAPYAGFTGSLAQSLRPFPQYQNIVTLSSPSGHSTYHALLAKVDRRFQNGLQVLLGYRFSKTLSDVSFTSGALAGPQDYYDRSSEKSLANIDRTQNLTVAFGYELPVGRGKRWLRQGLLSQLVGGWTASGIVTYSSGGPLRVTIPNGLPIFNGHRRPNLVPGQNAGTDAVGSDFEPLNTLSGQVGDRYLNPAGFAVPAPFTFGNAPVFLSQLRGPSSLVEDLSLAKRIAFGEKAGFELRADAFNSFNRRNLTDPITDLTSPNFGRITGQTPARVFQLGLRVTF